MKKQAITFLSALAGLSTLLPIAGQASPAPNQMNPVRLYWTIQQASAVLVPDKKHLIEIALSLLIFFLLLVVWGSWQVFSPVPSLKKETYTPVSYLTPEPAL